MNQVTLCGNLGKDFELFFTQNGIAYAKNSLAITKKTSKKEGNEIITTSHTDWIPLTIFGRKAEIATKHLKKGDKFLCNGEIYTSTYERNGQIKYAWEVLVRNFEFVNSKAKEIQNIQAPQQEKPVEIIYEEMAENAENPIEIEIPQV